MTTRFLRLLAPLVLAPMLLAPAHAAGLELQAPWPVVRTGFDLVHRAVDRKMPTSVVVRDDWRETGSALELQLPLRGSRGTWQWRLEGTAGGEAWAVQATNRLPGWQAGAPTAGALQVADGRVVLEAASATGERDLGPRWGQRLQLSVSEAVGGAWSGSHLLGQADFALPGLLPHSLISVHADAELQDPDGYHFDRPLAFVRGHRMAEHPRFARASIVYRVPLLHPDLSVASLVQVRRLTAGAFYDRGIGLDPAGEDWSATSYESAGAELTAQLAITRLSGPFEVGVRAAWIGPEGRLVVQPVAMGTMLW